MVLFTLKKAQFYDHYKNRIDERQWKAINKMLDKGVEGFEGGMTARKYMGITKVSKATATRDLQQLHGMGYWFRRERAVLCGITWIYNSCLAPIYALIP